MKYDLEERTVKFAEDIIKLLKRIKPTPLNSRIINQIVGSSGSIGANYCEANGSESRKDFIHKLKISLKEIKETKHWIRLLGTAEPTVKPELIPLWNEIEELYLIFSKIIRTAKESTQI
ncbi:MAG: four helix bundle protein [Microgenomates group bacterium]